MPVLNPTVSGQIKLSNGVSYAGSVKRSATTSAGSTYTAGSFIDCQLNEINFNNAPGVILSDSNQAAASINPSANVKLTLTTKKFQLMNIISLVICQKKKRYKIMVKLKNLILL